jgi:hypothetical protein
MPRRWRRLLLDPLLTVAGTAGIAALFLPFAWSYSPLRAAADEELWPLALPLFLAIFASAASIRWLVSGMFSPVERAIAYAASAEMGAVTLWVMLRSLLSQGWPANVSEQLAVTLPLVTLVLAAGILIRNARSKQAGSTNPVVALQLVYLAHAALLLLGLFPHWQIGACCVLVAAVAFLIQAVLLSAQPDARA